MKRGTSFSLTLTAVREYNTVYRWYTLINKRKKRHDNGLVGAKDGVGKCVTNRKAASRLPHILP
jgi:hypothetical protein